MILSMARWMIWKRRCSQKFDKNLDQPIARSNEFMYTLKGHILVLLKSATLKDLEMKSELDSILKMLK